jgi:hypothetical protein
MELAARRWVTAGFALTLASAGAIATPVAAPLPDLADVQTRAVQLTASGDAP